MNPHWRMDRKAVFDVFQRAWNNADAVTFDGSLIHPWFDCAAIRFYVVCEVPNRERLP